MHSHYFIDLRSLQLEFILGRIVAQLRMIFVPNFLDRATPRTPYVHVQPLELSPRAKSQPDPDTKMYLFTRTYRKFGDNNIRKTLTFPLTQVWQLAELLPKYDGEADRTLTCYDAVERVADLWLNSFRNFHDIY